MLFSTVRSKNYRPSATTPKSVFAAEHAARPGASLDEDEGMDVATYAELNDLTTAQVWQRIRRGEIAGRVVRGQYRLYQDLPVMVSSSAENVERGSGASLDASTEESGFGAFLDGVANHRPLRGASAVADFSSFTHLPEVVHAEEAPLPAVNQVAESPELRMLIEHLNMVRQENREILRLSEESIRRITSMSETIVASKENVIAEREEELKRLREQLDQRDRDVVRLQQNIEDLEMLARTLE